jgi:chorismate-pyruvate lyase
VFHVKAPIIGKTVSERSTKDQTATLTSPTLTRRSIVIENGIEILFITLFFEIAVMHGRP